MRCSQIAMRLFHDEPPLKGGGLHGRRGVHHEILCAVIQAEGTDQQALTAATLHNASLHIIFCGCGQTAMTEEQLNMTNVRALFQ